jgi:hypothetical protein
MLPAEENIESEGIEEDTETKAEESEVLPSEEVDENTNKESDTLAENVL